MSVVVGPIEVAYSSLKKISQYRLEQSDLLQLSGTSKLEHLGEGVAFDPLQEYQRWVSQTWEMEILPWEQWTAALNRDTLLRMITKRPELRDNDYPALDEHNQQLAIKIKACLSASFINSAVTYEQCASKFV